jgi:hypothetical protein
LSAFDDLCSALTSEQHDPPYFDFGPEPLSREDAVSALPTFLDQVGNFVREEGNIREVPLVTMYLRAGTFASLLAED